MHIYPATEVSGLQRLWCVVSHLASNQCRRSRVSYAHTNRYPGLMPTVENISPRTDEICSSPDFPRTIQQSSELDYNDRRFDKACPLVSGAETQTIVRRAWSLSWDFLPSAVYGDFGTIQGETPSSSLPEDPSTSIVVSPTVIETLQILPHATALQADLTRSTTRRALWDYFVQRALQVFLCWEPNDVRLDKRYNDPYQDNIPAVAIRSRPMMLASLALSAFHFAGGGDKNDGSSLLTSLMLEASNALAALRFQDQPRTFEELLTTIGTASLLYLLEPSVYSDMLPLSRTAVLCLVSDARWQNVQMPGYQAIMQIFRWLDICSQCSLKRYVPIPDEQTESLLQLRDNERATSLSPSYKKWYVHPLYAFAESLISPLQRVAWLIRVRQQGHVGPAQRDLADGSSIETGSSPSSRASFVISRGHFEELVEDVETMIDCSFNSADITNSHNGSRDGSSAAPDLRTDLNHLTTAVESALIILFYTRLKDLPWTSRLVRSHVSHIVESLEGVVPDSRTANGIVFPLSIAGLEAVDTASRQKIIEKLDHLPGIWSRRESRFVASLRNVWNLRDADPGAVWVSWIHQGTSVTLYRPIHSVMFYLLLWSIY